MSILIIPTFEGFYALIISGVTEIICPSFDAALEYLKKDKV